MTGSDFPMPAAAGAPALRALTAAGYTDLHHISGLPVATLAQLHGVGPKAIRILQGALHEAGLPPMRDNR